MTNKYRNRKVATSHGTFDSKREYRRYQELMILQRAGKISELRRQVKYELLPSQRINGKCVERPLYYIADFVYTKDNGGRSPLPRSPGTKRPKSDTSGANLTRRSSECAVTAMSPLSSGMSGLTTT